MRTRCDFDHHHAGGRAGFLRRFGGFMGGGQGFRAARMLGSGDLQLIILALLEEKPRHGYEIIKALEERSSGIYTPSPGVVYPALTYLEEMQYAVSEASSNKKLYSITDAGKEHLAANRDTADEMIEQLSRFGRKMARVRRHFAEEEEFEESDPRTGAKQEKKRVLEILRGALAEIRKK